MNKIFLFITLISLNSLAHDHSPHPEEYTNNNLSLITLGRYGEYQLKTEVTNGTRYEGRSFSKLKFGGYKKFHGQNRIGLFYSQNRGLRHSEDWDFKDGKWFWKDTSQRSENFLELIYTKRLRQKGLPLVYNFFNNYQINEFNGQSTFLFKPGLHYFFMESGLVKNSIKIDIPMYFALNYDKENLYRKGLYLAGIHHFSKSFNLAVTLEYLQETWISSSIAEQLEPDEPYEITEEVQNLGLKLIYIY